MDDQQPAREREAQVDLSRTWELELFISGATVFALLQLPGGMDRWWDRTEPQLIGNAQLAAFFAYYYGKLILYALISTFVLHLAARAYWVGLVGLHSVFPGGIRWDRLLAGPYNRRVAEERTASLAPMIRSTDDFSSLLFASGAVIVLIFVYSVAMVVVFGLFALAISNLFFGGRHLALGFAAGVLLFAGTPGILRGVDKARGDRIPPGSAMGRVLHWSAVWSYTLSAAWVIAPLSFVLSTNISRRKIYPAFVLTLTALFGYFIVHDIMARNGAIGMDAYTYWPRGRSALEIVPAHYENRRDRDAVFPLTPAIQSEIIRDPYVRLFIPITPERHNPLIAERCPDVEEQRPSFRFEGRPGVESDSTRTRRLLTCLARLQPVSLDGRTLDGLHYSLTTDAKSGLRGILAYIPVSGLAAGEHMLVVAGVPRVRPEAGREPREPRPPAFIRFWL